MMVHAQIKDSVMTQLELAIVILDLKGIVVKVILEHTYTYLYHVHQVTSESTYSGIYLLLFLGISCPGGNPPCNGNGQCDLTTGICTCNVENQGSDCSGKTILHEFAIKIKAVDIIRSNVINIINLSTD